METDRSALDDDSRADADAAANDNDDDEEATLAAKSQPPVSNSTSNVPLAECALALPKQGGTGAFPYNP